MILHYPRVSRFLDPPQVTLLRVCLGHLGKKVKTGGKALLRWPGQREGGGCCGGLSSSTVIYSILPIGTHFSARLPKVSASVL
jgi:hypothetical protein